ncbi:manganese-transporting P-type ATPase [Nematocida homosporus]|uniref:manganese-transporting P-type ATPase n=1 Tax=Nematocida homosporus TaxID=1912981 RepID=UPI00221F30E2|nr:manganese-transporting P-type ATPase [Nematocida homosporus]KAI5187452.1 manganese-transporting P-type ATPase [Nematocida homosporus]
MTLSFQLFAKRPFWSHTYVIPIYFYPFVYYIGSKYTFGENDTSGAVIGMFFWGIVQGFLFLSSFWGSTIYQYAKLKRVDRIEEATMVRIEKERGIGRSQKVGFSYLLSKTLVIGDKKERVKWLEFDNDVFYFTQSGFKQLSIDLDHSLQEYQQETITNKLLSGLIERSILPKNEFKIEPPTFLNMFAEHAVSPFFVFQIFCALLWMLDEYWKYSLFTFASIIVFEGGMVFQRLSNIRQMRSLNLAPQKILRIRDNKKEEVLSSELCPGDRIFIAHKIQIPADLLILTGHAVVNESMLSGEATPVAKESISESPEILSLARHKKHLLYGGTKLMKLDERGIECRVLRTGFMTEQGELIKSMIASEDVVGENNYEAYLFILAMLIFAICSCVYVVRVSVGLGKTVYKIMLECIMILTNVVPPELPMELTIAVNSSLQELVTLGVYCLEPFRIPFAGKITVCCFDKTGTLTELNYQLERLEHAQDTQAEVVLATCHSAIVLEGKIEGDPMDLCGLEFVKAEVLSDDSVQVEEATYHTIKKYSFDSDLKRMSALIQNGKQIYAVMKGAPETVKDFLASVPATYSDFEEFAAKGYRVLALAIKEVPLQTIPTTRAALEAQMSFAGFALYNSKLKDKAKETVAHLITSGHKVIMITGDNEKTAISVAKQLRMYNEHFLSGTEQINKFLQSVSEMSLEEKQRVVWPSVFARANPEAKEEILTLLNASGEYTLMCGDGTNDVGALKTAHAGIALLEGTKNRAKSIALPGNIGQTMFILDEEIKLKLGDASVAAPFTSRTGSLQSVIDVISRGRSALVSTVQMYKVLALNSLLSAYTLSVFDTMGIKYGDFQMTAAGILSAFAFTFFGKSKPLPKISKQKPVAKIFSRYIVVSVILQTLVHISSFYITYLGIIQHGPIVLQEKFAPSLANTAMFLLGTALQVTTLIVNYVGRPFRESLTENTKLFNSLALTMVMVVCCTLEVSREINEKMELVSIPSVLKTRLLLVIGIDLLLCLGIEKTAFGLFMNKTPQKPVSKLKKSV